jgi:hypothetical protein
MEPFRDDNDLIAELRALRPTPAPEFAAGLDERAAAGFPRRSTSSSSPLSRFVARLRALPPRRLAFSAGAMALAAVAVATAVVAIDEPSKDPATLAQALPTDHPYSSPSLAAPNRSSAGGPGAHSPRSATPSGGGSDSSSIEYGGVPPTAAGSTESSASGSVAAAAERTHSGPFASKARDRDVERSAEMVLGADPAEVGSVAAQVFDAVHTVDGIVLSSSVSGGPAGDAGGSFDLLIPSAKLGDALAAFSAIAEVRSRHEATDDITAATVSAGEHLQDSVAKIDGLLAQLAEADSDGERAEVEAELRSERRHAAALRTGLTKLDRRANLSRVSLRIETDGASADGESGSGWSIGDALDDAGHILTIAAGVAIVGLAILGPLGLIALLLWLANRTRLRRAREHALGQ